MTPIDISDIYERIGQLSKSIKKDKSENAVPLFEKALERYQKICYIYGKYLDKEEHPEIARMIYQADLEMTSGLFLSMIIFSSIGAASIMMATSVALFALPFSPFSSTNAPLYIIGLTLLTGFAAGGGFPFYLQSQISNKKMDIERNLPYALAFMSILASSGTTPLDILKSVANENYGHISREFSKVLFRVEILGEDAVTAMNSLVNNTPSDPFRDICIDISNLIYGGGGLGGYLNAKSKELMNIRRQTDKEFVESLGVFGEGYLGGVIMVLTLAILGIVITGALGIQIGPLKTDEMFFMLIYVAVPVINLVFLQILTVKYSTSA
ncbi:MAG: type II secretion system F family protein [Methanomicrobiaceae archaeon]|nr:type II secretion system F family protein [Methanomicrobiaceae archaeon]